MSSEQQLQSKIWFSDNAESWAQMARDSESVLNTLQQRFDYVVAVAERLGPIDKFVDFACGSGELPVFMAKQANRSIGVDFSPEMIELSRDLAQSRGVQTCDFVVGSVLDDNDLTHDADMIASLGLVEYLALDEMRRFLDVVAKSLKPGGTGVIESRNRLFNLISLNDYTRRELNSGSYKSLAEEAILISEATEWQPLIAEIIEVNKTVTLPESYPQHGVPVRLRHQYTPGQIGRLLQDAGLQLQAVSGYHYHGLTPRMKAEHRGAFDTFATTVQPSIFERPEAIGHCSSFIARFQKQ